MRRIILLLAVLVCLKTSQATGCSTGRFGSKCQYKCRCANNNCDNNGTCTGNARCQRGWFGPACQYVDVASGTSQGSRVTDGDDTTCIETPTTNNVTIVLNDFYSFTWLRVHLSNPEYLHNLSVMFGNDSSLRCVDPRNATVDNRTLDIHCNLTEFVQYVTLMGEGVRYLCSVYISGGRNVALFQNVTQTGTWGDNIADRAVDGHIYQELDQKSCSHSNVTLPVKGSWTLSFPQPQHVNRFVLFNRNDYQERLRGFNLQASDINGSTFNYTDQTQQNLSVYTVKLTNKQLRVSRVKITTNSSTNVLTLCEVEIYGDASCEPRRYGRECEHTCNCAGNEPCFVSTGRCPSGCAPGFHGEACDEVCPDSLYGQGCLYNCSESCLSGNDTRSCDHINGTCLYGCQSGFSGPTCSPQPALQESAVAAVNEFPMYPVVGGVVAAVVVCVIVVIIVIIFIRKNNRSKNEQGSRQEHRRKNRDSEDTAAVLDFDDHSSASMSKGSYQGDKSVCSIDVGDEMAEVKGLGTYYNTAFDQISTAVPVCHLDEYVASKDKHFFITQFNSISANPAATMTVGMSSDNKNKNRYKNICAYDHSRVHLIADNSKKHGNYINASYIEGYKADERFIASQGPTKIILEDFVRMLWEQQVEKVVMLTNLVEEGKQKCERYWPDDGEMKIGEITVRLTTTQVFADYTIRRLLLSKKDTLKQDLIHFHFTSWPDKDIPNTPWGLVDFEQRVASYPSSKPTVVHCSAGVGRTGTFIALRNVMRQAEETGQMDFFTTVQKLRHDRINMVQTVNQYMFLHKAARVAMLCLGTTVTLLDIEKRIETLEAVTATGQTQMEKEFKAVCSVCDEKDEEEETPTDNPQNVYENRQNILNSNKNRDMSAPPKEMYRARLHCENDEMDNYINAVILPSFSKPNQQILTQLPLPTTVTDFWRLVTQYKVTLIVAFQADLKGTDQSICEYLPSDVNDSEVASMFTITTNPIKESTFWKQQKLNITVDTTRVTSYKVVTSEYQVTHLACTTTDLDKRAMLAITQKIRSLQPTGDGRILYVCRDGATYSGLVCVLSLLLDRMDNDHQLTVPLVVGAVKAIRPQVIPTLNQYKLLYECLHLYGDSLNEYTNFGSNRSKKC